MENLPYGTLDDVIKNFKDSSGYLPEDYVKHFTNNTLKGLLYCEYKGVVIKELTPKTILFSNKTKTNVKFVISSASIFSEDDEILGRSKKRTKHINKAFAAPEVLNGENVDNKADIYSLGAILLIM